MLLCLLRGEPLPKGPVGLLQVQVVESLEKLIPSEDSVFDDIVEKSHSRFICVNIH